MRHILPVANVFGLLSIVFALTMLVPLIDSLSQSDGVAGVYLESIAITLAGGALLAGLSWRHRRELHARDAFLLVSMVWVGLPAFATLPLMLHFSAAGTPLSFTDAYFETVSAMTTTGATTLSGLDALPPSINFWRCLMQWLGGMGILVLAVAILPLVGSGGMNLFRAESAGPLKDTKLTPRITETAKGLWTVYCGISLACLLAYRAGGMTWPDAWMHMFTTMSLGGLSSHDASFGYFQSPLLEWIAVFFMLVASCNFAVYFIAAYRRSLAPILRSLETRMTLATMLSASLLVAVYLFAHGIYDDPLEALRYATFNLVSVASTTGFASTDYATWPVFAPILMILLSSFATSAGSTGAGIKMIRAIILAQQAVRELARIHHPKATLPLRVEGGTVENKVVFSVLAFMLMYGTTVIVTTLLLIFSGLEPVTAFTAILACVNNMGPGLGPVGPAGNYAVLTDFETWVCTVAMLLGRLEMFSLLVLLTPGFWRR
ncbi:TrkH family potassium uptake protein [Burkholderiaceae bacterium FT117]|uniref:TrkH family potassium uptake protein n=1 Tax=Zeimonas sediminis TaxID=2944268 RepID=UPI002342CB34|nr:potassium transporter TrkG [Zeimonas sediminis]MCM5570754.1 TrkH family potassium uptake protein [Zeimonas sediminis]